jgi:phosphoglycolate phosphatase-like HAD superfamily hydrolase
LIMDIVVDIADEVVAVGDTEGEAATAEMANQVRGVDVVDIEVAEMQQSCSKFSLIASNS